MTKRLNFMADPELAPMRGLLQDRLNEWVAGLDHAGFGQLLDPLVENALNYSFQVVNGSEGTVWLADEENENLVAAYNSGPNAESLIGFKQTLGQGIVSMVYSHERPYCENEIASEKSSHDDTLDKKLGTATSAMIAVPFYFSFGLRGVISCVQLENQSDSSGFTSTDVENLIGAASVVERLIDRRLITAAIGLEDA